MLSNYQHADRFISSTFSDSFQSFRNPFDIPRKNLVSHVTKMRTNFLKKCNLQMQMLDEDQRHTIPVQEMGNYQDYLKRMPPPLREVENIPVRSVNWCDACLLAFLLHWVLHSLYLNVMRPGDEGTVVHCWVL